MITFVTTILKPIRKTVRRLPVPIGAGFCVHPVLAVFRRFPGLLASGWYKLSSLRRKCLKSKIPRK